MVERSDMTEPSDPFRERIIEVLRNYNITLADAPLNALAMAMYRMSGKAAIVEWLEWVKQVDKGVFR
jgi:predicted nuclease with RNAse H fold